MEYWEYQYDLLNRLSKVFKNGILISEYGYDPEGNRVVKKAGGRTIHYVFEGTEPIFEKRINDGRIRSYVHAAGKHLARVDGKIGDPEAKKYWYHTDQIGSVKAVTDAQGNVVWKADYTPFGTQVGKESDAGFEESHGFTGKEYDADTGLYYFNARWYDPELGRFISEDPAADPNNPNLYVYSRNNPLRFTDPSGLISQEDAMELHDLSLTYDYPDYIMDLICYNIEKYGYENALEFGMGIYAIQLYNNGNLTGYRGWSSVALPEVQMLGQITGIEYDAWALNIFELSYKSYAHFGTNIAALDFQMNTQRVNQSLEVMGFAYAMGIISRLGVLPNNPEVEFKKFNLSDGMGRAVSKDIKVIGRLEDTSVARNWKGHDVLNDPNWTLSKNDAWVNAGIKNKQDFYIASPISEKNLISSNPKYPGETVFAREIRMLKEAGYVQKGNYFIHPDNLK